MSWPIPHFLQTLPKPIQNLFKILLLSSILFSVIVFSIVLYLNQYAGLSAAQASDIETTFMACNFCLHFLGGVIVSRFVEKRYLCGISLLCQASGATMMMGTSLSLQLWGLSMILIGTGFGFITINCMLTQMLQTIPTQRNTIFLWAYGVMNLGFVIGLTLSGLSTLYALRVPMMLLCALANLLAFTILMKHHHSFKAPDDAYMWSLKKQGVMLVGLLSLLWPLLHAALESAAITNVVTLIVGCIAFIVLGYLTFPKATPQEKQQLKLFFVLVAGAILFWTLYQLTPNLMMLFIDHHVDRQLGSILIPPQWFANINPLIILFGAPFMAYLLKKSQKAGYEPSLPTKFASGLLLMSIGTIVFLIGIAFLDFGALLNPLWIITKILFESFAELLISPIGLAMIGVLIPVRWQSMFMGSWMLLNGLASSIAGFIAHATLLTPWTQHANTTPDQFMHGYFLLASTGLICACFLFVIATTMKDEGF